MTNIAIEHGPVEIVDLPIENGWMFHSYVIYQMVSMSVSIVNDVKGMILVIYSNYWT